jgi:hypothetical protein
MHLNGILECFELTDGYIVGITRDKAASNYSMTQELQLTLDAFGTLWPAMINNIPCMAHVIQLALVGVMSSVGVKSCTKSCKAHECDQQVGENECTDVGKSQRL